MKDVNQRRGIDGKAYPGPGQIQGAGGDPLDAAIDSALAATRRAGDPQFEMKSALLASFDAFQRRKRNRFSLSLFADAFGVRALGRPIGAAALMSAICITGFAAGAASGVGADDTYTELAMAFDQSFAYSAEDASWAGE